MSNSYKRFLTTLTAATPVNTIVVPDATTAIVRSVIVTNVSGSNTIVQLTISPAGTGSHMLVPALSVANNDYEEVLSAPLNLEAADILKSTQYNTFAVTSPSGGVYYIDGVLQPTLELYEGNIYVFTYPEAHPFALSTTVDGTHGGGSEYTTGVTRNASANTLTYVVPTSAPQLYYYCTIHPGMGGQANTPAQSSSARVTVTLTALLVDRS